MRRVREDRVETNNITLISQYLLATDLLYCMIFVKLPHRKNHVQFVTQYPNAN